METVRDFILGGSKITADGDCSQAIGERLLLGRKVMTNLDSTLKKQGHYFANKGLSRQTYHFSSSHVWMWELDYKYKESWAPKNWCFWTVVLEKTLEIPLYSKEIQPVHPKGVSSGCSLKGLILKLKLQYFGYLMRRAGSFKRPWCWERLRAGGEGDSRGWDGWIASSTQWTWVWVDSGSWWWTGRPGVLQFMGSQRVGHDWVVDWTELDSLIICFYF